MANKPSDCFDLDRVVNQLAASLSVAVGQVRATVELLDAGNTIPFIARYRKEVTKGLDEIALRAIEDALGKKAVLNRLPFQRGDVRETFADITRAKAELGYAPSTLVEEGIPKFVDWFRGRAR